MGWCWRIRVSGCLRGDSNVAPIDQVSSRELGEMRLGFGLLGVICQLISRPAGSCDGLARLCCSEEKYRYITVLYYTAELHENTQHGLNKYINVANMLQSRQH
jgi:hypothetical protein